MLGSTAREAFRRVRFPVLSVSFTDDEMLSETSIRSLHAFYASAPIEWLRVAPRDLGVARIGHFGFFREAFAPTLWTRVREWLDARAGANTAVPA